MIHNPIPSLLSLSGFLLGDGNGNLCKDSKKAPYCFLLSVTRKIYPELNPNICDNDQELNPDYFLQPVS